MLQSVLSSVCGCSAVNIPCILLDIRGFPAAAEQCIQSPKWSFAVLCPHINVSWDINVMKNHTAWSTYLWRAQSLCELECLIPLQSLIKTLLSWLRHAFMVLQRRLPHLDHFSFVQAVSFRFQSLLVGSASVEQGNYWKKETEEGSWRFILRSLIS